jgi:eukaryotic-like serine/threonine-protein kinase
MSLLPGTRIGPHEILVPLGAGAMGEVYRARDTRIGRTVAIKILATTAPNRVARLEREARAISRVNHPHICVLYDIGHHDGATYLVMEHLEGETLAQRLETGPLSLKEALTIAIQIADALDAAHRHGVIHRDLKPSNIMLTARGVKLLDFGLAKLRDLDQDPSTPASTQSAGTTADGAVLGTYPYMAPEQVAGGDVDARADLFAVGVVTYEMVSGARPFEATTRAGLAAAILTRDPPPLSDICPPALDRVLHKCLAKDPDARWQTARDLASEFRWISEGVADRVSLSRLPVKGPAWTSARWSIVIIPGAVALTLVSFLAGSYNEARRPPPRFQRATFQRGIVSAARFAGDRNSVIFSAAWQGRGYELFLSQIASRDSRPLGFSQARIASVSRSGEMALILGPQTVQGGQGTLARAALSGLAPRKLLDDVREADWIGGGTDLAVVRRVGGVDVLEFPIGNKVHQAPNMGSMRVSRDGQRVAIFEAPGMGNAESVSLAIVDRSGRRTTVSRDWRVGYGLVWSPRGDEIWFTASRGVLAPSLQAVTLAGRERLLLHAPMMLVVQDVSSDGRALLTMVDGRDVLSCRPPNEPEERELGWLDGSWAQSISADGRFVLFGELRAGGGASGATYLRAMDGSPAIRLGDGFAEGLSPDGRWALATTTDGKGWMLFPTGSGSARRLPTGGSFVRVAAGDWLPGSRRIAFSAFEPSGRQRVYVQDIDGDGPRPITPEGVSLSMNAETPDGQFVLGASDHGYVLFPIDKGEPRPLPDLSGTPLQWSADGRFLFVRRGSVPAEIDQLEIATGRRQSWKTLLPSDPVGVERLFPIVMTPDGGSYCYSYHRTLTNLFIVDGVP